MAGEAVVSAVIQNVTYLLIRESILFAKVIDQVENIRLELRRMKGFLATNTDNNAKKWVGEYLKTLYSVEDIVESYVLRSVRKKTGMGFLKNYGFYLHDWAAYQILCKKMKEVEEQIKKLDEEMPPYFENASSNRSCNGQYPHSLVGVSNNTINFIQTKREISDVYEEDDFVGFKDIRNSLKEKLTSEPGKIIGVVGPFGSGKTTLVKRLYNRKSIRDHFIYHAWLDVSEEHVYKDLLLKLWKQVNNDRDTELTVLDEEQLKDKLSKFLLEKKYLIVLDDARKQPDVWFNLLSDLPDTDGCKVVLVAQHDLHEDTRVSWDKEGRPLYLQPLSTEESMEFLKSFCQQKGRSLSSDHSSLRNKILEKCQGLPLNIVLLEGILSSKKMTYEELQRLYNHPNWTSIDLCLLSYTDLPIHYKLCLLYLTLFPKESDFSVRRILRLWLAEGFLQCPLQMGEESEDLAEKCFDDLVNRNLIKISKFRSDGGPRKCHLPGFLRQHLSPIAQEISLYQIHPFCAEQRPQQTLCVESSEMSAGVRRIVEYADIRDYDCDSNIQNLRSYLSFNFQRHDTPATGVGDFLRKIIGNEGFGLLRVLDLEGVYKPILPKTLKHLLMLRYLGLRRTFLDSLPKSVGDLPYLETLDLKGTCINTLPSSVWKLKYLRHINLPQIRLNMSMQQPSGPSSSSKLLTLWGVVIDSGWNKENGLYKCYDLRELGISCVLEQIDELLDWITGLKHLQSLSLTSKDSKGRPSKLALKSLLDLNKLSRLKLLGKLSDPLKKDQFPPYLRVLTLSVTNLTEDPMTVLSQHQCLSVLRLLAKSYNGKRMSCPENGFKNLRVLKLWMLDELEELEVKQQGMPNIKELNIRCCQKLKEVSTELLQRTTLQELILTSMSDEFVKNAHKNKLEQTSLQTNSFVFTPLPWEKDPKLWE